MLVVSTYPGFLTSYRNPANVGGVNSRLAYPHYANYAPSRVVSVIDSMTMSAPTPE